MKNRNYFIQETNRLTTELKGEIKKNFTTNFFNDEEQTNSINFESKMTGKTFNSTIRKITKLGDNIIIYPVSNKLESVDLDNIQDIHDLLLIHYCITQ